METIIFEITKYAYVEFIFAVILLTELVRFLIKRVDKYLKPQFLTLIICLIVGFVDHKFIHGNAFEFYKAITSMACAILGYDLFWKPVKEKFFPKVVEKQRS